MIMISQFYKLLKIEKEEQVQIWQYYQKTKEVQEVNKIEINLFMILEMKALLSLILYKKSHLMFVTKMKI